ncbi:MAG: amidase family protein [Granulosicoccus sp.]
MDQQYPWSAKTVAKRLSDTKKRIASNDPELKHLFTQTFFDDTDTQINQLQNTATSYLCGAIVSVKDLFDVKGQVTKAGTTYMADDAPATADATPIAQLRDAGAVLIGHTTMTELAYSGLGINPHYGTPDNALMPGRIPGGSTSGGAVSVARHIADIALGTDTGGSLRIPAAYNGIVGFKPTQSTVSRRGCKTLSHSLDSVGPMARKTSKCELAYRTIKNGIQATRKLDRTLVVPTNYGLDDMDTIVAREFEHAIATLISAGFNIEKRPIQTLEELNSLAVWQIAAVEARSVHDDAYKTQASAIDPRIYSRLSRADDVDAVSYRKTLNLRNALTKAYRKEMKNQILLLPTVPIMPPMLTDLEASDDEYYKVNMQVLRNPSIANILDGCSISLPYSSANDTIGIMLTANALHDYALLDIAKSCEYAFSRL